MRIVVNDIAASEGGALAVLNDLYEAILENDDKNEWIFFLGDSYLESKKNIKILTFPEVKKSWLKRLDFELFKGKKIINKLNPDVYVSMQNTATLGLTIPQFVYFHQVIPYQKRIKFRFLRKDETKLWLYQNIGRIIYQTLFKFSNSKIIVQSDWLKDEMSKHLNNEFFVSPPQISNDIYNTNFNTNYNNGNGKKRFFYPTSTFKYKNYEVLFKAVKLLNQIGIDNFEVFVTLPKKEFETIPNVVFLGKISRNEVYSYMSTSTLIFPSLLESFGLPLLEAKTLNAHIIVADLEYAHEVLGEYDNVNYFGDEDYKELAKLMIENIELNMKINKFRNIKQDSNNNLLNIILTSIE
ncbi:glycosyltransferase [Enterococcus mundtii]|uniref:Glycosyl transferase family 1 domain-containing protein n=1 Tax=Enterococcus mundtii TaxID=53346 RepID=A0A242L0H6_ENTMU|nr:glycosyltransferase [Enterococcus mundtii]OTP27621.1 hypothetical protein A5802_001356 [Enterococcus mundtii]